MHSAANVLYHPAMGRWLFNIGIFFFLLSGPVLVFNLKRLFVPLFCGGLGFMVNAFVLLYADQIGHGWLSSRGLIQSQSPMSVFNPPSSCCPL